MNYDVIIVGGGVLGVSLAFHLADKKGTNYKVAVLERETSPGLHASGKNAGMFRQLYRNPRLSEWAKLSRELWPSKLREVAFQESGSLIVGREIPNHHQELFREKTFVNAEGRSLAAVLTNTDGLFDSPAYMQTLTAMAQQRGVKVFCEEKVREISFNDVWKISTESNLELSAPWVVNAAGAWINEFLEQELCADMQAFARHLFEFPLEKANCAADGYFTDAVDSWGYHWDEEHGWYVREWRNGEVLFSICDKVPANPESFSPSSRLTTEAQEEFERVMPTASRDLERRVPPKGSWYCFRTYVEDQLPIWGEDPLAPGLFWLGAFGGFGMSTSFGACYEAAKVICGEKVEIPLEFCVTRVRGKNASKIANA